MNTPKPCDECAFVYCDCMDENNTQPECTLGCELGKKDCKQFKNWEEGREKK